MIGGKMARGSIAKEQVISIIKNAFKDKYVGEQSGKLYVMADDGGEQVQIAISLTCPKVAINNITSTTQGIDFDATNKEIELTADERSKIENLMSRLM